MTSRAGGPFLVRLAAVALVVAMALLVATRALPLEELLGGTGGAAALGDPAPIVGRPAPDFTLAGLDGRSTTLSSLRGRPVLVNFWATWCGPCREEMPELQAAQARHAAAGLAVLFVDWKEPIDLVGPYVADVGIGAGVLLDRDGEVARLYRVRAMPTSYFVDRQGVIQAANLGAMDRATVERSLAKIL